MTNIGQNQASQELQAHGTSSFDDQLTWIAGLYYFQESANEQDSASVFPALERNVGDLSFIKVATVENHQYAPYVHATYALTTRLRLTVGARYTAESKYGTYFQQAGVTGAVQVPLTGERAKFHSTTPRLGLDYGFTRDLMAYVTAAKGFKSGGFNNISLANAYGPENIWTEEAGIRSEWWGHRLRANVSGFYSQYSDIQVSEVYATPGGKSRNLIANAASARMKGGELEITALPATGLSFTLNAGFIDARFTSAINTSGGLPPVNAGTPFVNVPRWSGAAFTQYTMPLAVTGYVLTANAAYSYRSRVFHDVTGVLDTSQAGYGLLDARISFGPRNGQWQLSAFGTNITNTHYITGGADFGASLGWVAVIEAPPAEWGLDLRYNF
jgi:iron complex outermembrane receptor protein